MTTYVYSDCTPGLLLHIVYAHEGDSDPDKPLCRREDISAPDEFLQVAHLTLQSGQIFRPHKHIISPKTVTITQESWVVIRGRVEAILYDIDDTIIRRIILEAGDCSITYHGGHNYRSLEHNTVVYEYKTGPYLGQKLDKQFIKEEDQ